MCTSIDDPSDGLADRPLKSITFCDRLEARRPQDLNGMPMPQVVKMMFCIIYDDEISVSRYKDAAARLRRDMSPRDFLVQTPVDQTDFRFLGQADEAIAAYERRRVNL